MFNHVLVVCVGNICRSPVAEGLLINYVKQAHLNVEIQSAGIAAVVDSPAHPISVELMHARGIDISQHRAKQLTSSLLNQADLVLVMETWHQREIARLFPSAYGKVHSLGKWGGFSIPDPIRKSRDVFEEVFALIEQGVMEWQKKIWSKNVIVI